VDLRELNKLVRPETLPAVSCDEVLSSMHGIKLFTTCDLSSAYNQIKLKDSCTKYFGISTNNNHYELTRLPAICQRIMTRIFRAHRECLVYLDDLILMSVDWDNHFQSIRELFVLLKESNLKLKPSKCVFAAVRVRFLGHYDSEKGLEMPPPPLKEDVVRT
jgi:hypothetical protein